MFSDFVPALAIGLPLERRGYVALGPNTKVSRRGRRSSSMAVFPEESMVLYHIRSQRTRITQDGKPSTTMGTPSFGAVETIVHLGCVPQPKHEVGEGPRAISPL